MKFLLIRVECKFIIINSRMIQFGYRNVDHRNKNFYKEVVGGCEQLCDR